MAGQGKGRGAGGYRLHRRGGGQGAGEAVVLEQERLAGWLQALQDGVRSATGAGGAANAGEAVQDEAQHVGADLAVGQEVEAGLTLVDDRAADGGGDGESPSGVAAGGGGWEGGQGAENRSKDLFLRSFLP